MQEQPQSNPVEIVNYRKLASDLIDQAVSELTVASLTSAPQLTENDLASAYNFIFCDDKDWAENREFWCDVMDVDPTYPARRANEKGFSLIKYRARMRMIKIAKRKTARETKRNYKRWMKGRMNNEAITGKY